jgi:hypothetical protein
MVMGLRVDRQQRDKNIPGGPSGGWYISPRQQQPNGSAQRDCDQSGKHIPSGTFCGAFAATLMPQQVVKLSKPHPVVVEVLDMASLPNKFKADYNGSTQMARQI